MNENINYIEVKHSIQNILKGYQMYLLRIPTDNQPKLTNDYKLEFKDDTAIESNIGKDINIFCNCFNRLSLLYRKVIWLVYFESKTNTEISNELLFSTSKINNLKKEATNMFALTLGINE